jgi:hypothetical protein
MTMTCTGTFKNGVLILPPEASLPEGAEVEVTFCETPAQEVSFLKTALKLAKPRPHLTTDYALNHVKYKEYMK